MTKRKQKPDYPVLNLALTDVRTDDELRAREEIDEQTVEEFAADMDGGDKFPPIIVFTEGKAYYLADGFHRLDAHKLLGRESVEAEVREGGMKDARAYATHRRTNGPHGLRLKNADKARMSRMRLEDRPNDSDRQIAKHVGVHPSTVAKYRAQLENEGRVSKSDTRTDAEGRQQPARKPSGRPINPDAIPMGDEDPGESDGGDGDAEPDPLPTDPYGEVLEPAVAEAFARKGELTGLMHQLSTVKSTVLKACDEKEDDPDPLFAPLMPAQFKADLANAYQALKACIPHAACPDCRQIGCDVCRGRGYVNKEVYDRWQAAHRNDHAPQPEFSG